MPKAINPLTYKQVLAITKVGTTALGGASCLYLQVNPNGKKYYVYRYKAKDGKRSYISLGVVGQMELAEARRLAQKWKLRVSAGENPAESRRAEVEELRKKAVEAQIEKERLSNTFAHVSNLWITERSVSGFWKNSSTGEAHAQRFLDKHICPYIGKILISDLTINHVFDMIKPIYQTKPTTADRCLLTVSSVWKWAKARGLILGGEDPASRKGSLGILLEPYKDRKKAENFPALHYSDIPKFFAALHEKPGTGARMTEFAILTALRSKMVRFIRWSDIDFENDLVVIPETSIKTKGRGKHTVFLSKEAKALLMGLPRINEWVFPSPWKMEPFSDAAMGKVFDDLHALDVKRGGRGWIDPVQSKEKGRPIGATAHGTCRATFKTWARIGENRQLLDDEAVELCLAHKLKDDYDGAYNRATLEPERREVM